MKTFSAWWFSWYAAGQAENTTANHPSTGAATLIDKTAAGEVWKYQDYFRSLVEHVREEDPKLVPSAVETTDFSLWRSLRRGAVLETTNPRVDVQVIELINRWRKKEAARGSEAGLPMRQVYTQVRSALSTMKEFSRAL